MQFQYTWLSSLSNASTYVQANCLITQITQSLTCAFTLTQVFAVKAKFTFPFGRSVVANYWNFVGIFAGACLGVFIIYTPPLHVVFGGSYHLLPLYWLIPMAFGVFLLFWTSIRVVLLRKGIESARVKDIKGLMMCECPHFSSNGSCD